MTSDNKIKGGTANKDGRMNIVQISSFYPPYLGGLERVAQEVSEHLAMMGYKVTVLTSKIGGEKLPKKETNGNLTIKRLQALYFAHTAFIFDLLRQLLKVDKPAIFHLHLAQAYTPEIVWIAAKIRNIPFVVHYHLDVEPSGFFGSLFLLYKKYILEPILRDADKIIVFSEEQKNLLQKKYGIKEKNIIIIPNGVSRSFFLKGVKDFSKQSLQLLYVGRLTNQKRVDRLVGAMALIDFPAQLKIVGDGEDYKELVNLSRSLGLQNVTFEGRRSGEDLMACYREADIFVIPSDREGMPLTVLEAMASGLPIVGSNVIGIRELVKNVGVLVDNPSPETFAKALTDLHDKPESLRELSALSRSAAEQYSWDKLVKQLEYIYNEVIR